MCNWCGLPTPNVCPKLTGNQSVDKKVERGPPPSPPPKWGGEGQGAGTCFSHTLHFVSLRKNNSLKMLYCGVITVSFCGVKRPEQNDENW